MLEKVMEFFKKITKKDKNMVAANSKEQAKERLHLVLMQDRANVSADFLELMKQEIIDVIKKYIDIDESAIDVRLTNKENEDGTNGAPALYANIPIKNIKNETRKIDSKENAKTAKNNEETIIDNGSEKEAKISKKQEDNVEKKAKKEVITKKETNKETSKDTNKETNIEASKDTNKETSKDIGKDANKEKSTDTNKETNKETSTDTNEKTENSDIVIDSNEKQNK